MDHCGKSDAAGDGVSRHRGQGSTTQAVLAVCTLAIVFAAALADADRVNINGYLQESIAVRRDQLDDVMFHRQTFNAEVEGEITENVGFLFEADLWRDDPHFLERDSYKSRIREAHVKFRFDEFDLRFGRFQIGWGQSDALIISDQVTPFDLTNFIVPEFDEIRQGVDGALLDYYFDSGDELQLVWLTRFIPPNFPDHDSPWTFVDNEALQANGLTFQDPVDPPWTVANSEYGIRYQSHPDWADWSVGYLRSWTDIPTPRFFLPNVVPIYDQFHMFMADIAYPKGNYLFRGETVYEVGKAHSTFDPDNPFTLQALDTVNAGFVSEHDVWRTLVAVETKPDFDWWQQADLTFQLVHEQLIDPHPALVEENETNYLVMIASAAYKNETIKPRLLTVVNPDGDDAWIQTKIDFEPFDSWRFTIEYDQFMGHGFDGRNGGNFGMFNDNDLFLASVRYSY